MNTYMRTYLVSISGMLLASCMQGEESVQRQAVEAVIALSIAAD